MSKKFRDMQTWRSQDKDHRRLIERFNSIAEGKQLGVAPAVTRSPDIAFMSTPGDQQNQAFASGVTMKANSPPSVHTSLNYKVRKEKLQQIDDENFRLLMRIAKPKSHINNN